MGLSVVTGPRAGNGETAEPCANVGLDVADAAYHTAHAFPGGVPALAQRMAVSQHTLAHKVSLYDTTHHLTLREAVTMQEISRDYRILYAMAGALGHVCVSMQISKAPSTMGDVLRMAREFGEMLAAVEAAAADGRVTQNEMHECERQFAELVAAGQTMLGTLRTMMPKPPGVGA